MRVWKKGRTFNVDSQLCEALWGKNKLLEIGELLLEAEAIKPRARAGRRIYKKKK